MEPKNLRIRPKIGFLGQNCVFGPKKGHFCCFWPKNVRLCGQMGRCPKSEVAKSYPRMWARNDHKRSGPSDRKKMHFHNSSVKKCRFVAQICPFFGILLQLGSFHATFNMDLSTANISGCVNGCSMLMMRGTAKIVHFGGNLTKFM